jgi:hypothetical protein
MKGVIFTEFIEMVEKQFGFAQADAIILKADPKSGGAYTAVGLYDDSEMFSLVNALSNQTNIPESDLLTAFGKHLFGRFSQMFPHFVSPASDTFSLLSSVKNFIHVEVHKLYPDALLPSIDCMRINERTLQTRYKSHRPLGDFAEGLIRGVILYFNEEIEVRRVDTTPDKHEVEFTLIRKS